MASRNKIFISQIDTSLSWHIIEQLRDDDIKIENFTHFVGTESRSSHRNIHSSVNKIFNDNQLLLMCRYLLDCPIFIIPLYTIDNHIEIILKIIEERGRQNLPTKVIGISPYIVWNNSQYHTINSDKIAKDDVLKSLKQSVLFDSQLKHQDKNYRERSCPPHAKNSYLIQQSILELNKYSRISCKIICSGLIYGKNFPQEHFHTLLSQAYRNEKLICYGLGQNFVPTVYIDDLMYGVSEAISSNTLQAYYVAVDSKPCRQIQILRALIRATGNFQPLEFRELNLHSMEQILMSENIEIQKSQVLESPKSYSFVEYLANNLEEVRDHLQLNPIHLIIEEQMFLGQLKLIDFLKQYYRVIQIGDQHFQFANKQDSSSNSINSIILKQMKPYIHSHFIISCSKKISLEDEIFKKFGLKRIVNKQIEINDIQIESQKFWKVLNLTPRSNLVQNTEIANENQSGDSKDQTDQIIKNQHIIDNRSHSSSNENQIKQKSGENQMEFTKNFQNPVKKNNSGNIDQYLIDNIICYLSEAYLAIHKTPTLQGLIENLQKIYQREQNKISED